MTDEFPTAEHETWERVAIGAQMRRAERWRRHAVSLAGILLAVVVCAAIDTCQHSREVEHARATCGERAK